MLQFLETLEWYAEIAAGCQQSTDGFQFVAIWIDCDICLLLSVQNRILWIKF